MDSSGKTPDFAYQTSLGTYLRFENLVYMYSMILDYHNSSGKMADFAMMKPWSVVTAIFASGEPDQDKVLGKDLVVTTISGPTKGVKGSPITILSTIKNQGNINISNNFIVSYYLSTDKVYQSNDYSLGEIIISGLTAGGTVTKTPTLKIPTIPIGYYYLLTYADRLNNVTELNETNNVKITSGQINISRSIILEDFADISNWNTLDGASISSNIIANDDGIRVTSTPGNYYPSISKNVSYNFNGIYPDIQIWFYLHNEPLNQSRIGITLYGNNDKFFNTYITQYEIHKGLNSFVLPQSSWIINNGITWNDTISKIQLRIFNTNNESAITFLSMEYNTSGTPELVITFDDGLESAYTYAYPIMKQYGIKGTVFHQYGKYRTTRSFNFSRTPRIT